MAKPKAPIHRSVRCYHCGHEHEIAARASRVSCPKCSKSLRVENVTVRSTEGWKNFQTCGKVTILTKGTLVAQTIEAHEGIEVRGGLDTNSYRGGPVVLKKNAVWRGDCSAPSVAIEAGARVRNSHFEIGVRHHPSPPTDAQPSE